MFVTHPTTQLSATPRAASPIDAIADAYVETIARLDPLAATSMGVPGHDAELPDLSPDGLDARADAARTVLGELDAHGPADAVDDVTLAAMHERIGVELELHAADELLGELNVIASPVQGLRDAFDLMPTATREDWAAVAARLAGLPRAIDGYVTSLRLAAERGRVAPRRQVEACLAQAEQLADPRTSFFTSYAAGARPDGGAPDPALDADLGRGADAARAGYGELARFLREELAARAPEVDAAGRERYALWSRYFLGASVDLEETYAWGLEELDRIIDEQQTVAAAVAGPGASVEEAMAALDADPARALHGTAALRDWMQETSDAAVAALDGTHFTIPEPVRALECRIAPVSNGGIYYTGPSDDFSRPGRMWWSVPPEVTDFTTWRERTTVYHEGVPGHHLQIAQTVYERATLNRWRRLACWVSGHGEGWALYAERLMADLGFLDDPGDRLGMLDGQRMRAARVVLDIGVHLGLPAPERWGGGTWDAARAWPFLQANANMAEGFLRFELDRYLGWPGQAPSYKVGQRLWEQTRDAARASAGDAFDLRSFHARALSLGSLGLDVLRQALA